MPVTTQQIREYYERNTRLFLRFGSSDQVQTIHRALWDGAANLEEALNSSNRMVLEIALRQNALNIADLGCGVGATLFTLLANLPAAASGSGLTLSRLQAQLAARAARALSLPKARFLQADFQFLPLAPGFDLAYSIEAFVHATEPQRYLEEVARILRPGGTLLILDDFLGPRSQSAWLPLYQEGWHVPNLRPPAEIEALAARAGLILRENRSMTQHLRLRALPDPLAHLLRMLFTPLWHLHPIVPSMLGSMALQQALRDGAVEYRWLVFEKR